MDIFKFEGTTSPTKLENGQIVEGFTSKLWVERYSRAGEFTLVAKADTDVRDKLPVGSLISHLDANEVMIVENHEISDSRDQATEVTITGRGFETFFEHRIIGSNKTFPVNTGETSYILPAANTWNQLVTLISDHVLAANLIDDNNAIPFLQVLTDVSGTGETVERTFKRKDLYSAVLELLAIEDLGIKVVRPGPWSPLAPGSPDIAVVIHKGVDRSNQVIFSYDTGEIESADYLWSNKKLKTAALVYGRWVETVVTNPGVNYERRMMLVDATDLDEMYESAPTSTTLTNIVAAMQQRGTEALALQNEVSLTKAEVSETVNRAEYRKDFDVGDIITVNGDYNATSKMRITEYVETEDESGKRGYPTLTTI